MNPEDDTQIVEKIASSIENNFRLTTKIKIPLKKLVPEPENRILKEFWGNNSHADIAVFRHDKLVAIVEPGGRSHFSDDEQKIRDKKKDKICKLNGINCLRVSNSFANQLDRRVTKKLLRKYFYSEVKYGLMK